MSEEQMTTQLVIPPGVRPFPEIFDKFDFQILQPYIEKFVMMTYDHHHGTGKAGSLPMLKPGWVKAQSELTLTSMFQIVLYLFFTQQNQVLILTIYLPQVDFTIGIMVI